MKKIFSFVAVVALFAACAGNGNKAAQTTEETTVTETVVTEECCGADSCSTDTCTNACCTEEVAK